MRLLISFVLFSAVQCWTTTTSAKCRSITADSHWHGANMRMVPFQDAFSLATTTMTRLQMTSRENSGDANDDNEDDDDDDEEMLLEDSDGIGTIGSNQDAFMSVVRTLQDSYYQSLSTPACEFQLDKGGWIRHLPILTWPWHEVPGRTNALLVHQPAYTHLMETLLRRQQQQNSTTLDGDGTIGYVGHVFRDGPQKDRHLQAWHDVTPNDNNKNDDNEVVLGTLMRIADYRRLRDGKLLVLVQGLERIVVSEVTQTEPYSIAHVQVLPDADELSSAQPQQQHQQAHGRRVQAVLESFDKWHEYEFDHTQLPLPNKPRSSSKTTTSSQMAQGTTERTRPDSSQNEEDEFLDRSDLNGAALNAVLPLAAYASGGDKLVERLRLQSAGGVNSIPDDEDDEDVLEPELHCRGILATPVVEPQLLQLSSDTLERAIWVYLDLYLKQTKRAVSPVLFGLLPPQAEWSRNFVLERIAAALSTQDSLVRVSPHYPAPRRQRRLSFAAAQVLEQDEEDQTRALRRTLLQIPTTQQRLAYVLQCLQDQTLSPSSFQ